MSETIVIVACSATKRGEQCEARDLYTGALFKASRRYAERFAARWFIVSAKHGLMKPTDIIAPYNETLAGKRKNDIVTFGQTNADTLAFYNRPADGARVVYLCGANYIMGFWGRLRDWRRDLIQERPLIVWHGRRQIVKPTTLAFATNTTLDLFAPPAVAPVCMDTFGDAADRSMGCNQPASEHKPDCPDANGFTPPAALAPWFPPVAAAEALFAASMNGYAARALMAFTALVRESRAPQLVAGRWCDCSYVAAAQLVNAIVRGVASDRPYPTVETCAQAAQRYEAWLDENQPKSSMA